MHRPSQTLLCAGILLALLTARASADQSTPFLEGPDSKVGAVSQAQGYVLAAANDDATAFLVLVTTDTGQALLIHATAEKATVPPDLLGKWVAIKAQVLKAPTQTATAAGAELKILSVSAPPKKT